MSAAPVPWRHAPARPRRRYGGCRDRQRPADHRLARDQPLRAGCHHRRRAARAPRATLSPARPTSPARCAPMATRRTRKCPSLCAASWSTPRQPRAQRPNLPTTPSPTTRSKNDVASSERCRQAVVKCLGPAGEGHYRGTLSGEDFSSTCAACRACSPLLARATPDWRHVRPTFLLLQD